jgi:hypothetical protein
MFGENMDIDFDEMNKMICKEEAKPTPISIEEAVEMITKSVDLAHLIEESHKLAINSLEDAQKAVEMAGQSRKLFNRLETARKGILRPHIDFQAAVNRVVKEAQSELQRIQDNLTQKTGEYLREREKFAQELIHRIDTDEGSLHRKKSWSFKISDESKIPREFLAIDQKAVEKAIERGMRKIEGLEIFEIEEISFRVKNEEK